MFAHGREAGREPARSGRISNITPVARWPNDRFGKSIRHDYRHSGHAAAANCLPAPKRPGFSHKQLQSEAVYLGDDEPILPCNDLECAQNESGRGPLHRANFADNDQAWTRSLRTLREILSFPTPRTQWTRIQTGFSSTEESISASAPVHRSLSRQVLTQAPLTVLVPPCIAPQQYWRDWRNLPGAPLPKEGCLSWHRLTLDRQSAARTFL